MKKIYVLLLVTAATIISAKAQPFQKGDKLLGGSISFQSLIRSSQAPVSPKKVTFVSVSPGFTFFTKPNQAIGFSLLYAHQTAEYDNNNKEVTNGVGASVYKQYWNSLGKNFYFIVEGRVAGEYDKLDRKVSSGSSIGEQSTLNIAASINPGISYRISKHLVTDVFFTNFLSVVDSYSKVKDNFPGVPSREYNSNVVSLAAGFTNFSINSFQFGFRYIL